MMRRDKPDLLVFITKAGTGNLLSKHALGNYSDSYAESAIKLYRPAIEKPPNLIVASKLLLQRFVWSTVFKNSLRISLSSHQTGLAF